MALWVGLLSVAAIAALWTVATSALLRAAIGLAATSILVTILLFLLGAPLAAVFELSVCAGLIPVLFVSVISMTRRQSPTEREVARRVMLRRLWPLPLLIVVAGALLALLHPAIPIAPKPGGALEGARTVMWVARRLDLFGQVLIILGGIFGVVLLFKEEQGS